MEVFRIDVSMSLGIAGVPPQHFLIGYHHLAGVNDDHVIPHILMRLTTVYFRLFSSVETKNIK